jgi:putative membrane protein
MSGRRAAMAGCALAGIFTLLGAVVSMAQQAGNMNSNMSKQKGSMSQTMLSSSDRKFMMTAAAGGMAEVEIARLAVDKASSDDVKKYAQQMIDDHTKANEELMQIASQKGVTLPTGPDAKHMALMAKMRGLSGADFDRMYVKEAGVSDHSKMEKLFMQESGGGKDADVKAFASKTLPTVQMHLKMARDMSGMMMSTKTGTTKGKM